MLKSYFRPSTNERGFVRVIADDAFGAELVELGFLKTEAEAIAAADEKPLTRAELEAKATELGIKFDKRTGDRTLMTKISEALEG